MEKINGVYAVENVQKGLGTQAYTAKEAKALNGPVIKYDISTLYKPTAYEIFSAWPDDIKRDYLKRCFWTYCGTAKEIGDMLGVSNTTVFYACRDLGVPLRKRGGPGRTPEEREKWYKFLHSYDGVCEKSAVKDVIPEETREKLAQISVKNEELVQVKAQEIHDRAVELLKKYEESADYQVAHLKPAPKDDPDFAESLATVFRFLQGSGTKIQMEIVL